MEIDVLYVEKSNVKSSVYMDDKNGEYLMFALMRGKGNLGEYRVVFI